MAKTRLLWCWRCKAEVRVYEDDREWAAATKQLKDVRRMQGLTLNEALAKRPDLIGVSHHHASRFGPPCHTCGKPLRSPRATHCAACGAAVFRPEPAGRYH